MIVTTGAIDAWYRHWGEVRFARFVAYNAERPVSNRQAAIT